MKDNCILQKKSDIGLIREKNEDSACVLSHPKDRSIKMLAIADGMGGKDLGDVASKYVIEVLTDWFKKESLDIITDTKKLENVLRKKLTRINDDLIADYGKEKLGTTLSMGIVLEEETVILNIGDSRCYTYKEGKLKQITEDDSHVWLFYKSGDATKDDLRYFSTSSFISACIGLNSDLCVPTVQTIKNEKYDMLLFFTDGVTDLLTDKKIKEVIEKSKKNQILDRLIQEAVYVDQDLHVPPRLRRTFAEPFHIPSQGKDNATGAIYIKDV